jgi:SulP family sulfate permease
MMVSTFLVTIVFDLTVAVELGLVLAFVLFVRRQSDVFRVDLVEQVEGRMVWRLYGALFFGAAAKLDDLVTQAGQAPEGTHVVLDASLMISLDTTGLHALEQLHKAVEKRGGRLSITGLHDQPRSLIERSGFAERLHTGP